MLYPRPAAMRILVIEDNAEIALLLRRVLASHDYIVDVADDLSGLEASREHLPHLIILDLLMPAMSGDEAVQHLRRMPETSDIPVVLMSAADDLPRRAATLKEPHYLSKPFDLDELLRIVRQALDTTKRA